MLAAHNSHPRYPELELIKPEQHFRLFSSSVSEEGWLPWLGGGREGLCKRGNEIKGRKEKGLLKPVVLMVGMRALRDHVHHQPLGLEGGTGRGCYWVYLHVGPSLNPQAVLPG